MDYLEQRWGRFMAEKLEDPSPGQYLAMLLLGGDYDQPFNVYEVLHIWQEYGCVLLNQEMHDLHSKLSDEERKKCVVFLDCALQVFKKDGSLRKWSKRHLAWLSKAGPEAFSARYGANEEHVTGLLYTANAKTRANKLPPGLKILFGIPDVAAWN